MTTIQIKIDCEEKTCDKCRFLLEENIDTDYCSLFWDDRLDNISLDHGEHGWPLRCAKCLEAEKV